MEAPDEALLPAEVHRALQADAGIDLPDQGGGHANVGDAAADERGGKRDDVGTHASSHGDQQARPVQAMRQGLVAHRRDELHRFRLFTRIQHQRRDRIRLLQHRADRGAMNPIDRRSGDEQGLPVADRVDQRAVGLEQGFAEQDLVSGARHAIHGDRCPIRRRRPRADPRCRDRREVAGGNAFLDLQRSVKCSRSHGPPPPPSVPAREVGDRSHPTPPAPHPPPAASSSPPPGHSGSRSRLRSGSTCSG